MEYESIPKKKLSLGETVRAFRVCEEVTQYALANKIGVPKQTISEIEDEKMTPNFQVLVNIAEALGYGVEIFLEQYLEKILYAKNVDFRDFLEIRSLKKVPYNSSSSQPSITS